MKKTMKKAIVAKKLGMTQVFTEKGALIPVTVLEAGPCVVVQKKTADKDGYNAVQVGFGDVLAKRVNKPQKGHFAKAGVEAKKVLKELRLSDIAALEVGTVIKADVFAVGDKVDIVGVSKGKGYQGAIRRFGQSRGPMSHGSKYHRGLGSMSSATTPGKVKKGKGTPGHMGHERVTVQNIDVVRVDADKNLLLVRGGVPGARGSVLLIKDTVKA